MTSENKTCECCKLNFIARGLHSNDTIKYCKNCRRCLEKISRRIYSKFYRKFVNKSGKKIGVMKIKRIRKRTKTKKKGVLFFDKQHIGKRVIIWEKR